MAGWVVNGFLADRRDGEDCFSHASAPWCRHVAHGGKERWVGGVAQCYLGSTCIGKKDDVSQSPLMFEFQVVADFFGNGLSRIIDSLLCKRESADNKVLFMTSRVVNVERKLVPCSVCSDGINTNKTPTEKA